MVTSKGIIVLPGLSTCAYQTNKTLVVHHSTCHYWSVGSREFPYRRLTSNFVIFVGLRNNLDETTGRRLCLCDRWGPQHETRTLQMDCMDGIDAAEDMTVHTAMQRGAKKNTQPPDNHRLGKIKYGTINIHPDHCGQGCAGTLRCQRQVEHWCG